MMEELMREKERLEGQLRAIGANLKAAGLEQPNEPLIDREGFPRADIDLLLVIELKRSLASLQSQYRRVMTQIEVALPQALPVSGSKMIPIRKDSRQSFARVNGVAKGSPAWLSGLQPGDFLLGSCTLAEFQERIQPGRLQLQVERAGEFIEITLHLPDPPTLGLHLSPV